MFAADKKSFELEMTTLYSVLHNDLQRLSQQCDFKTDVLNANSFTLVLAISMELILIDTTKTNIDLGIVLMNSYSYTNSTATLSKLPLKLMGYKKILLYMLTPFYSLH